MVKAEARIIGVDDAPFGLEDARTKIIGSLLRGNGRLEAVLSSTIHVDGTNATTSIASMITASRHHDHAQAIMLDGITFGGLNVVDIQELHETTRKPIIAVNRERPDVDSLESALERVEDSRKRMKRVEKAGRIHEHETRDGPVYFQTAGCDRAEATDLIDTALLDGRVPEPVRVAHLIAAGIKTGESQGGS